MAAIFRALVFDAKYRGSIHSNWVGLLLFALMTIFDTALLVSSDLDKTTNAFIELDLSPVLATPSRTWSHI